MSQTKQCGAKKGRTQDLCKSPGMKNGRCHLHGGLSSGPKTQEGKEKARKAPFKHGFYSNAAISSRKQLDIFIRQSKEILSVVAEY